MAVLKVLVLTPDPRLAGGVGQFLRTLIAHLPESTETRVLVVGQRASDRCHVCRPLRPLLDGLRLLMRARRVDVVHVNPSLGAKSMLRDGLFLLLLTLARRSAVVVFFHGWDARVAAAVGRRRWRRALFRAAFGRADHVFVLAEAFRGELIDLGLEAGRVELTTTMFDGAELAGWQEFGGSRAGSGGRLLFLGRMVTDKGLYELLDAFAGLRPRFPNLELVMAGDGPERGRLQQHACQLGAADAVHWPGFVSGAAKCRWLGSADLFVLPSYREGCPVALLEAMAMGLPVVASAVGGIPHVVEDGVNGVLIPEVSAATLGCALERLLTDPGRRQAMGEANRDKAWRYYEASSATRRIDARYRHLAARVRRG
jgi:glycosyltransferase involved in cell wall biosynthesis